MIKGSTANAWRSNEGGTPMRKICWRRSAQSLFFQLFFARLQSSAPADCHCALEVLRGSMLNPWRATDEGIPMRKNCRRLSAQSQFFQLSFARLQSSAPADCHCALENFRDQFSTPGGQLAKALLCARFEVRFRSFPDSSRWPSTAVRALCHHAAASAQTHRKRPSSS